ncbi:MAG: aminopeptidase P family protein [Acidimicrobiales bacterium]|nr:aminopeptidase P family protein [Hyphomonadaceae bacterium]RZV44645.1 MAG: aminopeptidase P family protein [Acidimicrobiales bacterium]
MHRYQRNRIMDQLKSRGLGGILLFDPINIRYATGSHNMQVWTSRNVARATFISSAGYCILWDFVRCEHLTAHLDAIDEIRNGAGALYFAYGDSENEAADAFVREVVSVMHEHGSGQQIAVDNMDVATSNSFQSHQITTIPGQNLMEHARLVKGEEEIKAMRCAVEACELSVREMQKALKPGVAEVELWSVLHAGNIARGGEWIETRLLASGPRTNPWMQEAGPRILQDGDLLAFDTDMIGLYGYCCDMSRTWLVGDTPNCEQLEAFKVAHDHITQNMELMKPGTSFYDLSHKGHQLPAAYVPQRYCVKMHGTGMCDEFPSIYYPEDYIQGAFDYQLEPGMVFSVEVYAGKVGGQNGVKLENQVLVTDTGYENLTTYPYDNKLLPR